MNITHYYPRLDSVRAIAVCCVLVHHFGGYLASFCDLGYYGVDLFLVISGFLITSLLISSNGSLRECYVRFLGRRTLRIFPLYYATLFVFLALDADMARENAIYLLSYTWNYAPENRASWLFYLWSLSLEEQFYLFWPFLVLLLRKRRICLLVSTLLVVMFGYMQLTLSMISFIEAYNYTGLFSRMGSLGFGAAASMLSPQRHVMCALNGVTLEVLTLVTLIWSQVTSSDLRFPVMSLCSTVLVLKAVHGRFQLPLIEVILKSRRLQHFGMVSYGIYLFHVPIGRVLDSYLINPFWLSIPFPQLGVLAKLRWHSWLIKLPLYSSLSWLLAIISYHWFEKPILAYKDLWFPSNRMPLHSTVVDRASD